MTGKHIYLILLLLAVSLISQAQVGYGLRGGLNFSSFPVKTYDFDDVEIETLPDSYTGWHIGGVLQARIRSFFIQPELLFVSSGSYLRLREPGEADFFYRQNFSKIDLPVLMGAKLGPLRLGAGPVGSYLISSSSEIENLDEERGLDIKEKFNNATFGFQLGAGFDLGNILLDFKYENSLTKHGDGIEIGEGNFPFDTRPRQFILSIGLLF
jgi:hypothetical protein